MEVSTDWDLIRDLLTAAVDACEAYERLGFVESDRGCRTGPDNITINDVMISAWTYPENLQYAVIRARHDSKVYAPYRPDIARILRETGNLCGELVGAAPRRGADAQLSSGPIRELVEPLCAWYRNTMTQRLNAASGRT